VRSLPKSLSVVGQHRRARAAVNLVLAGLVLAACGTSTSAAAPSSSRSHAISGGTATYALQATDAFSWILPYENSANEEPFELSTDEGLYRPLYFEGQGGRPIINDALSLAYPPVYSDGDRTVTIRLRSYRWSDGDPVTTRDIEFALNLYRAGESDIGTYVPGEFPDNVESVDYPSPTEFVLHLKQAYSQQWYTDNQLVDIVPLPQQVWDKTSPAGRVGNYDLTASGAARVFHYLYGQSEILSTYATNPLWKVVDGPWTLTSYSAATGRTVLTRNPAYFGPDKPHLENVVLDTFTSDTAEVDALLDGDIDYGYIPYSDIGLEHTLVSRGYTIAPWAPDYEESVEIGYTSPVYGPLVRQLYIRQALQHLVNEELYLRTTLHGIGQLTYGPVPNIPGSPFVSPEERHDPDPYSVTAARRLLTEHGWALGSSGIMVCRHPGTSTSECGKGIASGRTLTLLMDYTSTSLVALSAQAEAFQTAARSAGIEIDLDQQSATEMYSDDGVCPSAGPCNYALALYPLWFTNYGDLAILPTLGQEFGPGNYYGGGFSSKVVDSLITEAHLHSGLSHLFALEDYVSRDIAALWWPTGDNQISVIRDTLRGWSPQSPFGNPRPSRWYFVRS
jgi:peptide/nickel transport system substrate-binding protein